VATIEAVPASEGFFQVEEHGIDPIPRTERGGRSRDLAFIWAGAFFDFVTVLTASYLTASFGLGVWDGLLALLLGGVSGAVLLGLLSHSGAQSGLPQVAFTQRIFGTAGMKLAALLTLFLAVGWFAVDTVIAAQAGAQLLQVAGLGDLGLKLTLPLVILIAAASVVVAIYGHGTIRVLETWGAVVFGGLVVVLVIALAPQFKFAAGPTASGAAYPGAFVLGFMTCFALVASWYPFASDYSRYLRPETPARGLTWWPVVGVAVPMVLLGLLGLLLPGIDAKLAADPNGGVLSVISKHAPAWLALLFFLLVVAGELLSNYLDVYTAGLVAQTLGLRLPRWQTALGCGVLGAALAAYAVTVSDFHNAYEQFLTLTYLWAPAWAAIVLLGLNLRRPRPALALLAWAAGTAVSFTFVNYGNIYSGAHAFNDPLIGALHGADISGAASVAVAALCFWLGRRAVHA